MSRYLWAVRSPPQNSVKAMGASRKSPIGEGWLYVSNELYFETGGGDNARSDKKIKSACSRILGIEVSITRDVISPGGPHAR